MDEELDFAAKWSEVSGKSRTISGDGGVASERKISANRLNAKRSTGPKTDTGKARSSRNARQHGLSRVSLEDDVNFGKMADAITAGVVQQQNASSVLDLVRANLWLAHIRAARHEMLVALLDCASQKQMKRLAGLERYEKPARAAQRRVLRRGRTKG